MKRLVYEPVRSVEEIRPGRSIRTAGRTVFESDIATFCGLVGDANPIHLDESAARSEPLGAILVPATLTASMAIGLFAATRWLSAVLMVFVGMSDWRVEKPVFPRDTISARVAIESLNPTSDGDRHVLALRFEVIAERGPVGPSADPAATPAAGQTLRVMSFTAKFLARDQEIEAM